MIIDTEQRSLDWFAVRGLKLTASHASTIATAGKGLITYVEEIVASYYSGFKEETYKSEAMQRGIELEPEAKSIYELETGRTIKDVGFIVYNEFVGGSPDGLIDEDGGVEIKCHSAKNYAQLILDGEIDNKYYMQIQMYLLITNRKWFDYVGYNPNFKRCLYIKRIEADKEAHDKLLKGFEVGTKLIKERVAKMEAYNERI
jgi:putative phage-type endonuclease